jgi:hypothetical protein
MIVTRRHAIYLVAFVFLAAAGLPTGMSWWAKHVSAAQSASFGDIEHVLGFEHARGWTVLESPSEEGPYRKIAVPCVVNRARDGTTGVNHEEDGRRWAVRVSGSDKYEQLIVLLLTREGHPTYAVLKR